MPLPRVTVKHFCSQVGCLFKLILTRILRQKTGKKVWLMQPGTGDGDGVNTRSLTDHQIFWKPLSILFFLSHSLFLSMSKLVNLLFSLSYFYFYLSYSFYLTLCLFLCLNLLICFFLLTISIHLNLSLLLILSLSIYLSLSLLIWAFFS